MGRRGQAALVAGLVVVVLLGVAGIKWYLRPRPAGSEIVASEEVSWYDTSAAYDVGHVFTDGLGLVQVSPEARGPLRLVSATPLMDDGPILEVLGVRARLLGCGLREEGWEVWDHLPGFPPTDPAGAGSVPLEGLEVPVPPGMPQPGKVCLPGDDDIYVQLMIGYEVVGEGRSVRTGIELVYEYQGRLHTYVVPYHATICAPATLEPDTAGCPRGDYLDQALPGLR